MEIKATTRYARISPFKLRLPISEIKGKNAEQALVTLKFMPLKAAGIMYKTLQSAIANAEHNDGADIDELSISSIMVDEGPTMKRGRARAKGRGTQILKRTSHITLTVADSE